MKLKSKLNGCTYVPSSDWVAQSMLASGNFEVVEEANEKPTTTKKKKAK